MAVRPAVAPSISPVEMALLTARAGLALNPGQMADLVLAWRQLLELAALIPRERPLVDDFAFAPRLAPPPLTRASPARIARRAPPRAKPVPKKRAPAKRAPARREPLRRETVRRKTARRK